VHAAAAAAAKLTTTNSLLALVVWAGSSADGLMAAGRASRRFSR
jgi:hypothetical protein